MLEKENFSKESAKIFFPVKFFIYLIVGAAGKKRACEGNGK